MKKYSKIYNDIIEYTEVEIDVPFVQRIWLWVNEIQNRPLCECGNITKFNKNWRDGYKKYCSAKCAQSNEYTKQKRKETTLLKWGVDNVSKSEKVKEKQANTNIKKYGYKSTFQDIKVRDKWRNTILKKYGKDHYFKTDEFKKKTKKFYLEKWGVEHQLNADEIKEKIKNTCLKRYGVTTYLNTVHSRDSIKSYNISSYEREIYTFLESYNISYIPSERSMISPYTLDIYLPKHNFAIEFNGLYWHSELFKNKKYHLNKTELCNSKNIQLLHIWEDDWINRKDIVLSIIKSRLGLIDNKLYARKCKIKSVNNIDASNFLNHNHIQGYTKFSHSIGLYYNDELVSLMLFGWRSINGKKEYELIRFCNKKDYIVIGSASKLFNYFIRQNNLKSVTSYADVSMFSGNVYMGLGFNLVRRSDVNYWWVVRGVRKHRFNYNKKKLIKLGHDPLMTEVEIMHSLGNYRIWGCGQDKWVWSK